MLYHVHASEGSILSAGQIKRLLAFLSEHDGNRPPKHEQIGWLADLNRLAQYLNILPSEFHLRARSSAPVTHPSLAVSIPDGDASHQAVLEIVDGEVRKPGFPFDFLDHVSFRFGRHPVEVLGMSDEDWILARLSDTDDHLMEIDV